MKKKILLRYTIPIMLAASILKTPFEESFFLKSKYILWIVFTCIICITLMLKIRRKNIKINFVDIITILLSLLGLLTYLRTTTVNFYHVKTWYYLGYLLTYYIGRQLIYSQKDVQKTMLSITILTISIACINACIAFLQYFNTIPSLNKYFKVTGMFHSPNQLGALLGLGILSILYYLKLKKYSKTIKIVGPSIISFLFSILVLTESRGAFLALLTGVIVLNIKKISYISKQYKALVLSVGLIVIVLIGTVVNKLYHKNPESVYGRYFILKTSLQHIAKNPWGLGINSFTKEYNQAKATYFRTERNWEEVKNADFVYAAFNDFLELTFEMGIIWFFIFVFLVFLLLKEKSEMIEVKMSKALICFMCVFALTNSVLVLPVFVIISIFCAVIITQQYSLKPLACFRSSFLTQTISFIPVSLLFICIPARMYAEIKLFKALETPKNAFVVSKALASLKKIDQDGKAYFTIAKILKKNNQKELVINYLDTAFKKSAMPSIGRPLAYEYLKKSNISKAIELFEYNKLVEPYRYQARIDLLKLYSKHQNISKALKIAAEIIEFPVKIPSKKVDRYKKQAQDYLKLYQKIKLDTTLYGIGSRGSSFKSTILNKNILYFTYQPRLCEIRNKLPVLYVNDGLNYLRNGELAKKVDSLIHHNIIEPLIVVFIEPKDLKTPKQKRHEIRQELYLCNDLYSNFISKELAPYIENNYPASTKRSILGVSFGGLAAAYTAITNPNLFENIILQSPAFHPRKEIYKLYKNLPKQDFNIYLSYGTGKDTENQDLLFIKIIKEQNYNLEINVVPNGNHNWKTWEPQLNNILIKYFGR